MLFKPNLAEKILAGEKTQTRRLVKPGHVGLLGWDSMGFTSYITQVYDVDAYDRVVYRRGNDYAVCPGRGKSQVGRIRIKALRKERVEDITDADAIREGFSCHQEFLDAFKKINPKSKLADLVWVIDFELVKEA